jgi:Fe2+ transport system protein FeoA
MKLCELKSGASATITCSPERRLQEMGLFKGTKIYMMTPGHTCIIKVGATVYAIRADLTVRPI